MGGTTRRWFALIVAVGVASGCGTTPDDSPVAVADGGVDATTDSAAPDTTVDDTTPDLPDTGGGDARNDNPKGSGEIKTATIGAAGGEIVFRGVTLVVPPGAVPEGTGIIVIELAAPAPATIEAATPVYAFSPDGLAFKVPAKVKFAYDQPRDAVVYWSRKEGVYEKLTTARDGGFLVAELTHFSGGFVGFTGPPPDGGAVDATPDAAMEDAAPDTTVTDSESDAAATDSDADTALDTMVTDSEADASDAEADASDAEAEASDAEADATDAEVDASDAEADTSDAD